MGNMSWVVSAATAITAIAAGSYVMNRRARARGFQATRIPATGSVAVYKISQIERSEHIKTGGVQAFLARFAPVDFLFAACVDCCSQTVGAGTQARQQALRP